MSNKHYVQCHLTDIDKVKFDKSLPICIVLKYV